MVYGSAKAIPRTMSDAFTVYRLRSSIQALSPVNGALSAILLPKGTVLAVPAPGRPRPDGNRRRISVTCGGRCLFVDEADLVRHATLSPSHSPN